MNSGRETTDHRYLIIGNGSILFCCDTQEEAQRFIQTQPPEKIAVYQKRYVTESLLCSVGYEDEMNELNNETEQSND